MGIVLFRLITSGLLPVAFSAGFYQAEKKTRFADLPYMAKQVIIGICFGGLAVLSTEFGIPVSGAVINVRDAAPLAAGLVFGAPAGIIAGLIGGVERWFAALWGRGVATRLACTLATILAGMFGAAVRVFLLDNKRPTWFYGLSVGITTEVLHMIMVFLTNSTDIRNAFHIVRICAAPMITANALSVMLAAMVVGWLGKERVVRSKVQETKKISQTFQLWLLICVMIAFVVTGLFIYSMQTRIATATTDEVLQTNIEDVKKDIVEASNQNLLSLVRILATEVETRINPGISILRWYAWQYDLQEINIIDENGIIISSSNSKLIGFDMAQNKDSAEFLVLLEGEKEYVQDLRENAYESEGSWKFAGVALSGNRFLQVGCLAERFQQDIDTLVGSAAKHRHIGQNGSVIICNENGVIVSDRDGHEGENISLLGYDGQVFKENTRFEAEIYGEPSYCMYSKSEGYVIISVLPKSEALFTRDVAVYLLVFMEVLVFAALFAHIAYLVKKVVVENIQRVNTSLAEITGGNLNVTVDVRTNEEFASLSDDINSTVVTLKHYIDEAAARIDKELEFAKQIQHSALPSVFPPYPNRKDFAIFASMDAAKEVGGDFYDFYMLGENQLAFMIADVSGKGIPGAMFMMTSKTMIKSFAESGLTVGEVFTHVNAELCTNNEAGMFVTAWLGILDLETGLLRYVNAGHNPPVIRHKDGNYEYLKVRANLVLAGMENVKYREQQLQLQPGDEIYLYTDGVTEAHNADKQLFGEERLLKSLNATTGMTVEQICRKVKEDVDRFVGDADQFDDITMLSIRLSRLDENAMITLEPTMESVAQAAAFVEEQLESLEVPMKISTKLMIAVDEIYSNIVRYSQATSACLKCAKENDVLVLTFQDNGKPYNPLEADAPDITASAEEREIGGLGIFMVRKMMDTVDYEYTQGKNRLVLKKSL